MTAKILMEEIMTRGWGALALLCLAVSAVLSLLLLVPAGRQAARSILRRRGAKKKRLLFPVYVLPAVGSLVLLVPAAALLNAFGKGEEICALVYIALLLPAAVLGAYPVCEQMLKKGYAKTSAMEVETARTLGMSDAAIRRDLLAGRSGAGKKEAYFLTLCRILAELLPGTVTAALLLRESSADVLTLLSGIGRSPVFWEAVCLSAGILILAALVVWTAGRIFGRRRQHGT